MISLLAALLLSPVALAQDPAPAESAEEAAKSAFLEGRAHFEAERYEEAIVAFERALELSGRAGLLLNVALAQEQLGQTEAALETLARFRQEGSEAELAATESRLAEIEARLLVGRALQVSERDPGVVVVEVVEPEAEAETEAVTGTETETETETEAEAEAETIAEPAPPPPLADTDDITLIHGAVAPTRPPPRWGLVAFGATTAITFGATAGVTYRVSRSWLEEGDRAPYVVTRPFNQASIALAGVGTGLVVLGFTMREPERLRGVTIAPQAAPAEEGWVLGANLNAGF